MFLLIEVEDVYILKRLFADPALRRKLDEDDLWLRVCNGLVLWNTGNCGLRTFVAYSEKRCRAS
jgi:hypothetical protein